MSREWFNDFVHKQSRKLYGYAFRILGNQEEAEDALQEIFIKLWKMGDRLNQYNSVDALALTMTKNYCIDQLRKSKTVYLEGNEIQNQINMATPSPLDQLIVSESNFILLEIIGRLPEIYQDIVRMRDIEGLSYDEIAYKTDLNINTLRVNLSRGRKFIRDEYNKYQHERKEIK